MKTLLSLIAVLLLCSMSLSAQKPIQDTIPQLQEWWRAPANEENIGVAVGWLPNFYNGRDAMAITTKNGTETWLNRFPGDRENVFTWKGAPPILRGDFNGDGITDYIDNSGSVYRGKQNGGPPEAEPVKRTRPVSIYTPMLVADVNKDGYDDAVVLVPDADSESESMLLIYYGAKDFASMDTLHTVMKSIMPISLKDTARTFRRIYKTKEGNIRLIVGYGKLLTKALPPYRDGFELYALEWDMGGFGVTAKKLSEYIKDSPGGINKNEKNFSNGYDDIYQSDFHDKSFFLAVSGDENKIIVFEVSKDTFAVSNTISFQGGVVPRMLKHSIDGDQYEDWYVIRPGWECWFFSGGNMLATQPFAKTTGVPPYSVASIGDVNGDSVPDVVMGAKYVDIIQDKTTYYSVIFKGRGSLSEIVEEEQQPTILELGTLDTAPFPIIKGNGITLSFSTALAGKYSIEIRSLIGEKVSTVFNGFTENGERKIRLEGSQIPQSSGMYVLRLQNSKGIVIAQRSLIVQ